MRRRLSSRLTFFYKLVFPTACLGGLAIGTIAFSISHRGVPPSLALAILVVLVFFWRTCFPLKRVEAGDDGLWVSNYSEEISISYSEIEAVYENKFLNIHPVTIVLRQRSRFGREIRYIPYVELAFWRDHPTAEYLRARAGLR